MTRTPTSRRSAGAAWRRTCRAARPRRQARRPRAFFHRALAPAAALLVVAAILGGVLTLMHYGKSSTSTSTLAAKGNYSGAPEAAPGAATGATHMASPVPQGPLAADYDTVVVARAGQVSGGAAALHRAAHAQGQGASRRYACTVEGRHAAARHAGHPLPEAGDSSAQVQAETLGLFGGRQAPAAWAHRAPRPSPPAAPQRILRPAGDRQSLRAHSLRAIAHALPHTEVLVEPLPPGTKADIDPLALRRASPVALHAQRGSEPNGVSRAGQSGTVSP